MRKVITLLALVLVSTVALAYSIDVQISPDDQTIRMNETAEYTLTITHNAGRTINLNMHSLEVLWSFDIRDSLRVPPSGLVTKLRVHPLRELQPGYYGLPMVFTPSDYSTKTVATVLVGLRPQVTEEKQYTPNLKTHLVLPSDIDPREPFQVLIDAQNLNHRNISDMTVHLRSTLINEDHQVTIDPMESKQFVFNVELDPTTPPQTDTLFATFVTEHEGRTITFDAQPQTLNVVEFGGIDEEFEETRGFLRIRSESHLTNTGNARKTITYTRDANFFSRLFTTTGPKVKAEDGVYKWEVTLDPQESRTIVVQSNYWPLFVFFVVIILVLVGYYVFRAPIVVRKEVRKLNKHELRVSVFVRNRNARTVKSVALVENVAKLFTVTNHFGPGKVKPAHVAKLMSKRTNDHRGTRIKWDIGTLSSTEEAVVQYTIKTKLAMVGTVTLNPIVAHYRLGDKQSEVKSKPATAKVGRL